MIGTGGTIASMLSRNGLDPKISGSELLNMVPSIRSFSEVDTCELFRVDSTNMSPDMWLKLAEKIKECYDSYDGFVISHGTDTMAYTAAALSYLIQNSYKPIVLTGAQKPIGNESTDSKVNLSDAFICASSDMPGVQIVFNGKVILGTRALKTHTKSYSAFDSINYPVLGVIQDGNLIRYIDNTPKEQTVFYDRLGEKVCLLKLIPGMQTGVLEYMLENYSAVIIESFGAGGLPTSPTHDNADFHGIVRKYAEMGKTVVMTTQTVHEGSDLSVYKVGSDLIKIPGIIEAYDMTTETIVAKMMWILGQTSDTDEIRKMFYTPVAHDILRTPQTV